MISRVKNAINANIHILKNMTWLTVLQFANYLIPLLLIPYVVRVLGTDVFGKVSYAQNIITYLTILVTYGFEYSATQEIALNKNDKIKTSKIFWSVIKFKIFLLLISFVVFIILVFSIDKIKEEFLLYFYGVLINIGFVFFPTWFFQGIEKMDKMTIFNFIIKLTGAILILLIVKNTTDYPVYLLILSVSYAAIGITALLYTIRVFDLKIPDNFFRIDSKLVVIKGFPIFLNNIFATLYTIAGITILGFFATDYKIGIYSGAFKIISAILMITSYPINIALFPTISRKFSESFLDGLVFYKKSILLVGVIALLISLSIYFLSDFLVFLLLGNEFEESIAILKILSFLPFLVIMASMFTVQGMYGLQLEKYAPYVGLSVGTLGLIINFIMIKRFEIIGAAWAYVISEILEILFVIFILYINLRKRRYIK